MMKMPRGRYTNTDREGRADELVEEAWWWREPEINSKKKAFSRKTIKDDVSELVDPA